MLAGQLARGGDDHHLGLAEGAGIGHGTSPISSVDGLAEASGRRDHPVGPFGRTTDPETGVAPFQESFGDRVEDLVEGIATLTVALAPAR